VWIGTVIIIARPSKFDKMTLYTIVLPTIDDFSVFYKSIIFTQRHWLMENERESFTLSMLDHIITPHYPARNSQLKSIPPARPFGFERIELIFPG